MSFTSQDRFRQALPPLAALFSLLAVLSLPACHQAAGTDTPLPAVQTALERFVPAGTAGLSIHLTSTAGIYRFTRESSGEEREGEVMADGTLLWLASEVDGGELPEEVSDALGVGSSPAGSHVERVQVMAYEVETERPDGSAHERFVDPLGHLLFEVVKGPQKVRAGVADVAETLDDLAPPVAETLRRHLGDAAPTRLQREVELGSIVHTAKWRAPRGPQEVKILDSGLTLFLELPADEPVPAEVRRQAGSAGKVEALIFEVYWLRDETGGITRTVLANGRRIDPPARHDSD